MNKILCTLVILISCVTFSFADPLPIPTPDKFEVPKQSIVGAETPIPIGEMVILSVSPLTKQYKYLTQIEYNWKIIEDGREKTRVALWPDKSKVVFGISNPQSKVAAILSIAYMYTVPSADGKSYTDAQLRMSDIIVVPVIIGNNPGPGPNPNPPGPGPQPPSPIFPPSKYNLEAFAYSNAMMVSPSSRTKGATVLASTFSGVSSSIVAGAITDLKTALTQTKIMTNNNLANAGISVTDWQPFSTALQNKLYDELYSGGTLKTAADYAEVLNELAKGLNSIQ